MKKTITALFGIIFLSFSILNAQDVNSMNKKDLRDHITTLSDKIHSLEVDVKRLRNSKNEISANSKTLENKINVNNAEIEQLNVLLEQSKTDLRILSSQNENTVSKLNESISTLRDSILSINNLRDSILSINNLDVKDSTTSNSDDFLNNYFFDQIPLPNNSFQFVLSKIVIGNKHISKDNDDYYSNDDRSSVHYLPETLNGNAFAYWSAKSNVKVTSSSNFSDLLDLENKDYFDSKLPQIEILKNKLFTIIYNDDTEESFLFNVKESNPNNQRNTLQIDLANEGVENNTANDIVWRIFAIENECYLALTYGQLNRLKLDIYNRIQYVEVGYEGINYFPGGTLYTSDTYKTTGNGIYLSRNKDSYMDESQYINPKNLIFLLKVKEL